MERMTKIKEVLTKNRALNQAAVILSWDLETEAPVEAIESISKTLGYLSELSYLNLVNDEFKNLIYSDNNLNLNDIDKKLIEKTKKDVFEIMSKIPVDMYSKYSELRTLSTQKWQEAKQKDDLSIYAKYLEDIIRYNKEFIKLRGYEGHPYSLLLSDYENGLTVEDVDTFFEKLKVELVPFIKKLTSKRNEKLENIKKKFKSKSYDIEKQKKLSKEISEILKFDYNRGVIKESEHPFTTNTSNRDVRITTHYYENDPLSAIYSTIHETGHALYEQHISDVYQDNFLGGGVSMGIHESQSRIYENMFSKNKGFLKKLYELMDKYFGMDITLEEFELLVNEVSLNLIRTESDELTYPLHILIRYELEKEIFENLDKEVDAFEISKKWNDKYEQYLGIKSDNYSNGVLQDVHWSQGLFGYFPSYALGSAYSAQIYDAMSKDINIDDELINPDFTKINDWLKDKIHQYGSYLDPKDILINATGKDFDPTHYINYLKNKYAKIYEIEVK
ncbi:carboxypeptidase M32 [Pseudostreptobacillus hongkongensis]|uniref:carboxypeptidase M32 n=1 Tax=Pseudostreptobacillus hongkongensis TaxID=1162717 RepID=UPI000837833F|nr:carboxypeptidase M32 [Pseudostreptobacillus hongkongensis]